MNALESGLFRACVALLQYLHLYDKLQYIFGAALLMFIFYEIRSRR